MVMGLAGMYGLIYQGKWLMGPCIGIFVGPVFPWVFLEVGYYSKNRLRNELVRAPGLLAAGR
jgi:hypothetical protein